MAEDHHSIDLPTSLSTLSNQYNALILQEFNIRVTGMDTLHEQKINELEFKSRMENERIQNMLISTEDAHAKSLQRISMLEGREVHIISFILKQACITHG